MNADAIVPVAETTRNGEVESIHYGLAVALAADGTTAWSAGDAGTAVYPRSALKPLQSQAMVEAGLQLEARQLAVACASHNGEPVHLEAVRSILATVGLDEGALRNTPAYPLGIHAAEEVLRDGGQPSALRQNCSGKHAAMLATAVINGWSTADYLDIEHPVQQLINAYIATAAGGVGHVGIDGCGAPAAMISLVGLAAAVRSLATGNEPTYRAMTEHPELVAGEDRDDTALMRAVPGLLAKGGAEGVYVVAHPDGRAAALKISDGGDRARLPVMLAVLRSLDFVVDAVAVSPILGHGQPVGVVRSLVGRR